VKIAFHSFFPIFLFIAVAGVRSGRLDFHSKATTVLMARCFSLAKFTSIIFEKLPIAEIENPVFPDGKQGVTWIDH
jgi:hypothetical protein